MKPKNIFRVVPSLPEPLISLRRVAYNIRWSWNNDALELFRRLDSQLWDKTHHNPVLLLGQIGQEILEAAAVDEGFLSHLERVSRELDDYLAGESTWFGRSHGTLGSPAVAYFSAEFGLTECLSIFAGGLGVLSGDHLKSASDLGVPLVGIGLLYQQGYFQQYLNEAGWQQEEYKDNDFDNLPLVQEKGTDGIPLTVEVDCSDRKVQAQVWKVQVGRIPLYLLDTNLETNHPDDQKITHQLYGGDGEMRIKQEIVLGIGGYRALEALGLEPQVYHMNEGHSAFLALEKVRRLMEIHGLTFDQARELASAGLIFTTHTPVPAGHDYYPPELMDRYFKDTMAELDLTRKAFLALGRQNPSNTGEPFCMTVLALRISSFSNGVSRLHGRVSRAMWKGLYPDVPEDEIPIEALTNGVHFETWVSQEMKQLFDRYLGPRWRSEPSDTSVWQRALHIAPEELWRTHERRRERLVSLTRRRLRAQLERRGAPRVEIETADEVLDSEALTIGFSRRFAAYKRATLLLQDPDRLARIVSDPARPVQIIYAGKAHPHDDQGKALIQRIIGLARDERFRLRIVFLEDYDMTLAREMVQGCDIWLNNPARPREACGTSGMKASANGVLHVSTLDGWWDEAYVPGAGWAIGRGETYDDRNYQDRVESEALYDILERDVITTFFDRDASGLPRRWIESMKNCIAELSPGFNSHRMVAEYTERYYLPAMGRFSNLNVGDLGPVKDLAEWKAQIQKVWAKVLVDKVDFGPPRELHVGEDVEARAWIGAGSLSPEDIRVELYIGPVDAQGEIREADSTVMEFVKEEGEGRFLYEARNVTCRKSGLQGFTVRVRPYHSDLKPEFIPGLIVWA